MKKTCLYPEHQKLGARFTEFGGWEMPVFYSSIMDEHHAVRRQAGIFDTSHMGEIIVSGEKAAGFLNRVTVTNVLTMLPGDARYSLLLNERGGVIDDLIIYRRPEDYLLIVNASNLAKDYAWLSTHRSAGVALTDISGGSCLLALQGPASLALLQRLVKDNLGELKYYGCISSPSFTGLSPRFAFIARTGYTGEDGFEILLSSESAVPAWRELVELGAKPCGLGCRDTLRLEAGMPLHGHEIDEDTTPLEAGLGRVICWENDFIGRGALLRQKEEGVKKFLTAFTLDTGVPRANCDIMLNDTPAGRVTSGTFSPTLKKGIALGYVDRKLEPGAAAAILIHGQPKSALVVKKPFYKRS